MKLFFISISSILLVVLMLFSAYGFESQLNSIQINANNSMQVPEGVVYIEPPIYRSDLGGPTGINENLISVGTAAHTIEQIDALKKNSNVSKIAFSPGDSMFYYGLDFPNFQEEADISSTSFPIQYEFTKSLENVFAIQNLNLIEGDFPKDNTNETIISNTLLDNGYKIGSEIMFKNKKYKIVGVFQNENNEKVMITSFDESAEYLSFVDSTKINLIEYNQEYLKIVFENAVEESNVNKNTLTGEYGNIMLKYNPQNEKELFLFLEQTFPESNIYSKNYKKIIKSKFLFALFKYFNISFKYVVIGLFIYLIIMYFYLKAVFAENEKLRFYKIKKIKRIMALELMIMSVFILLLLSLYQIFLQKNFYKELLFLEIIILLSYTLIAITLITLLQKLKKKGLNVKSWECKIFVQKNQKRN
ncbi:MAG: ABC transporter permease [Mycoplasmatales bacterium]